jgi:hypothetical protein
VLGCAHGFLLSLVVSASAGKPFRQTGKTANLESYFIFTLIIFKQTMVFL